MQNDVNFWNWLRERSRKNQELEEQKPLYLEIAILPHLPKSPATTDADTKIDFEVDFSIPLT